MRLIYISLDWVRGCRWLVVSRRCTGRQSRLVRALWTAAQSLGVDLRDRITVEAIQQQQRQVIGVLSWSSPRRTLCLGSGGVVE